MSGPNAGRYTGETMRAARKHWYKPGTRGSYDVQMGEWTPFGSCTVIYIEGEF